MRVLFFFPNYYKSSGLPQGVPYLSSVLKHHGHETRCLDTTFIKCPDTIKDMDPSMVMQYKKSSWDEIIERDDDTIAIEDRFFGLIDEFKPDLLAVSTTTDMYRMASKVLTAVRQSRNIPVVWGGVHPTIDPETVISNPAVDMICIGEGEDAMVELCNSMERGEDYAGTHGLWVKQKGRVHKNPVRPPTDIDALPVPDWSILDQRQFIKPFRGNIVRMAYYLQSRGCPYGCTYCTNNYMNKLYKGHTYYRRRANQKTIDDLVYLKEAYQLDMIRFFDDTFLIDSVDNFEKFKNDYLQRVNMPFIMSVRPNLVTEDKVRILAEMGCKVATIGIETGSERVRREIFKRNISDEQIVSSFKLMKKYGIETTSLNMIGIISETRNDLFKTVEMNREVQPDNYILTYIYPYPRTEYRDLIIERGADPALLDSTTMDDAYRVQMSEMSTEELQGLFRTVRLYNKLPRELFPIIRLAEKADEQGELIRNSLLQLMQNHYT